MKHRKTVPARNPLVAPALFRKAGAHGKTEKALRRAAKMELQNRGCVVQLGEHPAFTRDVESSSLSAPTSNSSKKSYPLCASVRGVCAGLLIRNELGSTPRRTANRIFRGGLAQLGEHMLCKHGVAGSIPASSTNGFIGA